MRKKMLFALAVSVGFLLLINPLTAQGVEARQDLANGLGDYIESEFDKTHIPGMSVEIVDATQVLFAETYGNCETLEQPFIIGSISKSFTALAIMQLVEQGQVELSTPISDYLPDIDPDTRTTVKQLLNQTSGIETYNTLENYQISDTPTDFQYANTNYALLGQIIENVSGIEYSTYIQTHIFDPLNMTHSYTSIEKARTDNLVPGYRNYFGLMVEQDVGYPTSNNTGWITVPAGYIISSTNDMGRYLQMYLNQGKKIIASDSMELMLNDNVVAGEDYYYGMGLGLDYRSGELMVVHGGNVENYTTYMIMLPQRGIAAIMMFNACDFFISNELAIQLSYNVVNKYLGLETDDIGDAAYYQGHAVIDAILIVVLILSVLPFFLFRRWNMKNTGKVKKSRIIHLILLHIAFPTLLLIAFPFIGGIPLSVVQGFVPDAFITLLVCSGILYLTGIAKILCLARRRA